MSEHLNTVVDALKKLDPAVDAHWTTQGLPRLDAVKELCANENVSRKDVQEAVDGLVRANHREMFSDDSGEINPLANNGGTDEITTASTSPMFGDVDAVSPTSVNEKVDPVEAKRILDEAEEKLVAARAARDKAVDDFNLANHEYNEAVRKYHKIVPPETTQESIRNAINAHNKYVEEQHANVVSGRQITDAIGLTNPNAANNRIMPSKLDAAYAARPKKNVRVI